MSAAAVAYALCALTSLLCAGLLVRSYVADRLRLLLWAGLCFVCLAVNNVLLFVERQLVPEVDLSLLRDAAGFAGVTVLLLGLIWESR